MLGIALAVGAAIRVAFVVTDERRIGGDGFSYHYEALRLADGLGYTSSFFDVGAPIAHHPPGWVTLLGIFSWLGARSPLAHQLIASAIGLGVVVVIALVGRRYFNERTGGIAAIIAALYPGFWALEARILSEPLGLLLAGFFMLLVADLRERPTFGRSFVVGVVAGLLTLVRSEQLALLILVVSPVLLFAHGLPIRHRALRLAVVFLTCGAMIAPWAIYNSTRFDHVVVLSSNSGGTLLGGNCLPSTYSGERMGYYDDTCIVGLAQKHLALRTALRNIGGHLPELPAVVAARFGRMLAVFRPSQTVGFIAYWMNMEAWVIWAWVTSYWLIAATALAGGFVACRQGRFLLPLLAPVVLTAAIVAITFGEPRYHAMADLGVILLAAVALERLLPARSAT